MSEQPLTHDRPAQEPVERQCSMCGVTFTGDPWHTECAVCAVLAEEQGEVTTPADAVTHDPAEADLRALFIAYRGRLEVLQRMHRLTPIRFAELAGQYGRAVGSRAEARPVTEHVREPVGGPA
jgi:hypothetical protein